jgi:membrane associated rhomboid family serine protease
MRFDMHYDAPRRRSPLSLTPWVRGIIMANAVVYLLTITVFTGPEIYELGAFRPLNLDGRLWTFVTYMFIHADFLHLLFNMLMLFFFGPPLEERMGGRSFALFYFTCGIGGAVLSLALVALSPAGYIVGASGAVMGVALAFAINWPDAPIYVFPLPVPIKVKWLVTFLVVMNLWAASAGANTGVAYLAHLGGLIFGFIYLQVEKRLEQSSEGALRTQPQPLAGRAARGRKPLQTAGAAAKTADKTSEQNAHYDEVDRVLDKISESGLESLTPDERRVLDEASRDLRKH